MTKKTIITVLLALLTMSATCQGTGATVDNTPGWLWEISGNGLKQKSYLFGTCHGDAHNYKREDVFSFPGMEDAFGEVKAVFFEAEMNPVAYDSVAIKKEAEWFRKLLQDPGSEYKMPEGITYEQLYDSLSHYKEVSDFLFRLGGSEYGNRNPKYWNIRLALLTLFATRNVEFVDKVLYKEASKQGKECGHLEEMETSDLTSMMMTGMDTLSMKAQADSLYVGIHSLVSGKMKRILRELTKAYLSNDTCQVAKLLEENPDIRQDNSDSLLLYKRNMAWMPIIRQNIAMKPCMIAVGLRHLMGSDGLIAMLRKEGYTVEPVKNK